MAIGEFADWLYVQLIAVNLHLKLLGEEPADDYMNTAEYYYGYRDALKRALKFFKSTSKEVE
jgi:hypothetical protein